MISFVSDKQRKLSKIALIKCEGLSFSALQKLLRNKDVKVNGKRINTDINLNVGDVVELYYTPIKADAFSVVFADSNVLVINKKKGFTSESVYQRVLEQYNSAGFIHRLDRNTDGVMIFSLNSESEKELLLGFKNHTFEKEYLATVYGVMDKNSDVLTAYLLKDSDTSTVKIFDQKIKGAVEIKTGYDVIKRYKYSTLLRVKLYTGKTHQIRAHFAHIGHFVLGDGKYGNNSINDAKGIKKQMLQSNSLTLHFDERSLLYYLDGKTFSIKGEM